MAYEQPEKASTERLQWSPNYDKELFNKTRQDYAKALSILNMYAANPIQPFVIFMPTKEGTMLYLRDMEAIRVLTEVMTNMKTLMIEYKEDLTRINDFEDKILGASSIPLKQTIVELRQLGDIFIQVMGINHSFRDRVDKMEPWEKKNQNRFNLPELQGDALEWYIAHCANPNNHKRNKKWKQIAFFWTQYCIQRKGDIYCLVSGINDSGKTNTIIPMLKFANFAFRDCWHVQEDRDEKIELHKFSIDWLKGGRDVIYDAKPEFLNEYMDQNKYYQTIDVTEGMGSGTNLESMSRNVIKMNVKTYRLRRKHDIIAFEYQVSDRPPKLLITRFNSWIHKMNWYWGVYSVPSPYYRTKDPLYLKRIDAIAEDDKKLAKWFVRKSMNPNYITKFKSPHMTEYMQSVFDKNMDAADDRIKEQEEIREARPVRYITIVKEMKEKIDNGFMVEDEIVPTLIDKGFKKVQIEKIQKLFEEYDAFDKWAKEGKKVKISQTQ